MKKGTRKHTAGLGSGSSFFFCISAEERNLLKNLRWKKRNNNYLLDIPQQTIV